MVRDIKWLIDAANFCMIEFICPSLPNAHYTPTDGEDSPGGITHSGERFREDLNKKHDYKREGD